MKILAALLFTALAPTAFSQSSPPAQSTPDDQQTASQSEAQRSAIEVKPGSPVIKQKDIWNETGFFHPFVRMPKYILQDQKAIWTSPAHTANSDIKWWAIFGATTAGLIATDRHFVGVLPNSSSQISASTWASRFGSAYFLVPVSAGFYVVGTKWRDEHFRETGLLCFETLLDANITAEAIKLVADRARPLETDGKGHFEDSPTRWSSGFPSGHAINTWAMASIIAHQYRHPRIIPITAYALATTVIVARVGARQHFPGDVLAGSAMGWFIGDYVYGKRHNQELDHKPTVAEKILDHVRIGAAIE